jgi:hypothetical protein
MSTAVIGRLLLLSGHQWQREAAAIRLSYSGMLT